VVNRWWELVDANPGIGLFTGGVSPWLLEPPVNVLRLSLHPDGMAPRIANLPEWRSHLLTRLHRQAEATGDARLAALHTELAAYPGGEGRPPRPADVVVPLRYRGGGDTALSFISITAVVGTPMDVTVEELAIESFYPALPRRRHHRRRPQRTAPAVTPARLSLRSLNRATLAGLPRLIHGGDRTGRDASPLQNSGWGPSRRARSG
jgi:transcription regulator MmyB-like protein